MYSRQREQKNEYKRPEVRVGLACSRNSKKNTAWRGEKEGERVKMGSEMQRVCVVGGLSHIDLCRQWSGFSFSVSEMETYTHILNRRVT